MIYTNQDDNAIRSKAQRYYLQKDIIKNYNVIINGQPIDSDIKKYKEIRKLTIAQHEDYTTGCLLDCQYIKNNYKLIAVHLSRQKEK